MSATKLSVSTPAAALGNGVQAVVIGVSQVEKEFKIEAEAAQLTAERVSALEAQLKMVGFKGAEAAVVTLPGTESALIFVGLGKKVTPEALRRAAGAAVRSASGIKATRVAVALPTPDAESLTGVAEGASLGAFAWNAYKSKDTTDPVAEVEIVTSVPNAEEVVRQAEVLARHVKNARVLVNTPPCDLYPQTFAEKAIEGAKALEGVTVNVWDEKKLAEEGCGGLVGVGQGSIRPPRLVQVAYTPAGVENPKHLSIVGKGVTFDSGGLSLKPSAKMHEMKGDMGGAAATLHAVLAAAELRLPVRVTGWLCLAENMPSGSALKNGDVIKQRNGLTVEIHNTDAEGRLVLADGLSVAQSKKTGYGTEETDPDLLINIATLTGAQLAALGMRTAGLMGDERAVTAVQRASAVTGELFWAMPFPEELLEDLKSSTADLKNIGSVPYGGMLKAGVFVS